MKTKEIIRCPWCLSSPLMTKYHDEEWGVPVHDDRKLFEFFVLDAFQAGLSWSTILNKRENFRIAFDNFQPEEIALFDDSKYQNLLLDTGIIRNRAKIQATFTNAKKFLEVKKEFGTFDKFIWKFVNNKTIINHWEDISQIPPKTELSDEMSKELIKRGFKFVGSTICYAFMQAAGLINDHIETCSFK